MMFQPSGGGGGVNTWAATSAYVVGDIVSYGKNLYICIVAHTAGSSFESDLIAGKWEIEVKQVKGVNLILTGSTFEDNSVGGWTASGCATVTNGFPASVGTGGAAFSSSNGGRAKGANTTNPAIVSSGQINGQYSLNFATSGAGTIGDMYISSAHPIPIKYQAKVLAFEIAFKVVSGTPVMGGTSSNTYAVAIYDPVNNSWIQPTGCFSFTQSSGVGIASGTFQVPYNSTSFQIAIYNPVAPTGASSLYIDDIWVGPQSVVWGVPVTDWVSYTPTITSGAGTIVATITGNYRRVGDSAQIQIQYTYTSGTGAAADFNLSLPSGLVADTNKSPSGGLYGSGYYYNSTGTGFKGTEIRSATTTSIKFTKDSGAFVQGTDADETGTVIGAFFTVPIAGWSSNTVMSSDAATQEISLQASTDTARTVNNTSPTIVYDLVGWNKGGGSYDSSTGIYTVNVPGKYKVSMFFRSAAYAAGGVGYVITFGVSKNNGAVTAIAGVRNATTTSMQQEAGGSTTVECNAGDTLRIKGYSDTSTTLAASSSGANWFTIERISGPAQIAASETVAARYIDTAGAAVPDVDGTVKDFSTKDYDTHGAVTTGASWKFTAPVSGLYEIDVNCLTTSTATVSALIGRIRKNGSTVKSTVFTRESATSSYLPLVLKARIRLLAGEYVDFVSYETVNANSWDTGTGNNSIEILKVGNY